MSSLRRATDQLATASDHAPTMQLSEDAGSKYARVSGKPVEPSMLKRWIREEARDSASPWLVRLLFDAPQHQVASRSSELGSLRRKAEEVISKNMSLPIPGSHTTKRYSSLGTAHAIGSPPSLSDCSSRDDVKTSEAEILESLIQLLYRALFTQVYGSYRTHGSGQTYNTSGISRGKSTSAKTGKRKQRGPNKNRSSDNDDGESPEKKKQPRMTTRNLDDLAEEFACPLSKGDERLGMEARCRDWSSTSIDTVIRRHLQKHIDCDHIEEDTYKAANRLMRGVSIRRPATAAKLWTDVFMLLFTVAEGDRYTVPNPYWEPSKDLQDDPHYRRFALARRRQLDRDPASADQWTQFLEQRDELERERNKRKARAKKNFEERKSQLEAELEQTNAEIDKEIDAEQKLLKDRCIMQMGVTVHAVSAEFSGQEQPARPSFGYMTMSPPQGFEQMESQQAEQSSFADNSLFPSTPPTPPLALDPRLATGAPRVNQVSVSPYELARPLSQDADVQKPPIIGLSQGLPGSMFDEFIDQDAAA